MDHLPHQLRELLRSILLSPFSSSNSLDKRSSFPPATHDLEESSNVVEHQVEMAPKHVLQFKSHHYQYCISHTHKSKPSQSTDVFTLFPLLPPELRVKIWEVVAEQPYTVELSCTPCTKEHPSGQWFSHSPPPTILRINSESRAVAQRKLSILSFSPGQMGTPPQLLYFNFSSTKLWLCTDLPVEWAKDLLQKNEQLKKNLRHLVITSKIWMGIRPTAQLPSALPQALLKWDRAPSIREGLEALDGFGIHVDEKEVPKFKSAYTK